MKYYKITFSQDEIDAIWIVSHNVCGKGEYKKAFSDFKEKLEPYVSEHVRENVHNKLDYYCYGELVFNGNTL